MMFDEGDYCYSPTEVFSCINSLPNSRKAKMMMNKRRFTDEQVKSLESIFENETKLEPKKKVQVARELGLQPRQVAIWFQNKRARYKSKQLEKDYNSLRTNYNALAKRFEDLKKEKQSLVLQLEQLKGLVGKGGGETNCCARINSNESDEAEDDGRSESENNKKYIKEGINSDECEVKPALSLEGSEYGACSILSDEGSSENTNYFGMEDETRILTMVQTVEGSLTSGEGWEDLHPEGLFDQAVDSCQWWDFWS